VLRYAHTVSRFWWLLLIPLLVLPVAEYWHLRTTGSGYAAGMNIYVQQTAIGDTTANNPSWLSLAQVEAADITQWLQSPTFCLDVAESSPLYARQLVLLADPKGSATADLQQHVLVTAQGNNMVSISYTSKNPTLAMQVVKGILDKATANAQVSNGRVGALNKAYYQARLYNAEATERQSAQKLSAYMQEHGVTATNIQELLTSDLTLAMLYDQDRNDQQTVATLRQQIDATVALNSLPASLVNQNGYFVADQPSASLVTLTRKKELFSVGIAVLLGLLLAGALLVMLTAMDRTFRRPVDVPLLLDVPVLAVVPYSSALKRADRQQRKLESVHDAKTSSGARAS